MSRVNPENKEETQESIAIRNEIMENG